MFSSKCNNFLLTVRYVIEESKISITIFTKNFTFSNFFHITSIQLWFRYELCFSCPFFFVNELKYAKFNLKFVWNSQLCVAQSENNTIIAQSIAYPKCEVCIAGKRLRKTFDRKCVDQKNTIFLTLHQWLMYKSYLVSILVRKAAIRFLFEVKNIFERF